MEATLSFTDSSENVQSSYKVLSMDFGFTQDASDRTGVPAGLPHINYINFVVESTTNTEIVAWMMSVSDTKNGKIEIELKNNETKTIRFSNAYCVRYHESYNHMGGESPMHLSFSISVMMIDVDTSTIDNQDMLGER